MSASETPQQHDVRSRSDNPHLNTLPDPRSLSPLRAGSRAPSRGSVHHPDLSNEVAALSTKLVNALNYQVNLDDSLQNARHELETAKERVAQLENITHEHERLVQEGSLVTSSELSRIQDGLRIELGEEQAHRAEAEKQKKVMELELESLTGALFEQANSMVASARREREQAEQRSQQLKGQLSDAEVLLASHQAQLRELKTVLSELQSEQDQREPTTAPSTPVAAGNENSRHASYDADGFAAAIVPDHPLHFSNMLQPIMRTDLQAYEDFLALLRTSIIASTPGSRTTSGNFAGLNVMGLGSLSQNQSKISTQPLSAPYMPSSSLSSSSPNMPGSFHPGTPSDGSSTSRESSSVKDAKFYKRAITEDIEPTLRLDSSPGLSWIARRTVLNSMASGALIVEPFPPGSRYYSPAFPCSLCGETRTDETHLRTHRFRTSDADDAQRYPLCDYCLTRLRATADFVGFLRLAKNGHWRNETEDDERIAWEECTRLREKMFWSRLGGGVIPVTRNANHLHKSPEIPEYAQPADSVSSPSKEAERLSEQAQPTTTRSLQQIIRGSVDDGKGQEHLNKQGTSLSPTGSLKTVEKGVPTTPVKRTNWNQNVLSF